MAGWSNRRAMASASSARARRSCLVLARSPARPRSWPGCGPWPGCRRRPGRGGPPSARRPAPRRPNRWSTRTHGSWPARRRPSARPSPAGGPGRWPGPACRGSRPTRCRAGRCPSDTQQRAPARRRRGRTSSAISRARWYQRAASSGASCCVGSLGRPPRPLDGAGRCWPGPDLRRSARRCRRSTSAAGGHPAGLERLGRGPVELAPRRSDERSRCRVRATMAWAKAKPCRVGWPPVAPARPRVAASSPSTMARSSMPATSASTSGVELVAEHRGGGQHPLHRLAQALHPAAHDLHHRGGQRGRSGPRPPRDRPPCRGGVRPPPPGGAPPRSRRTGSRRSRGRWRSATLRLSASSGRPRLLLDER